MIRFIAAALACAVVSGPALAQLPEPLEAALSVQPREVRPSGLDFRLENDGEGVTVRVDLSAGEPRYTLLEPAESDLTEIERGLWEDFLDPEGDAFVEEDAENGESGGSLIEPVNLRSVVGDSATLEREEAGLLVYRFTPQAMPMGDDDDPMMARLGEHLTGEIAVDPVRGEPAWLRLSAPESFKPHMAVRISDFALSQTFVHEPALAGPRLQRLEMGLSGSAAFQQFSQAMVMEFSNMVFAGSQSQPDDLGESAESP